jgi:hypothetical protein
VKPNSDDATAAAIATNDASAQPAGMPRVTAKRAASSGACAIADASSVAGGWAVQDGNTIGVGPSSGNTVLAVQAAVSDYWFYVREASYVLTVTAKTGVAQWKTSLTLLTLRVSISSEMSTKHTNPKRERGFCDPLGKAAKTKENSRDFCCPSCPAM